MSSMSLLFTCLLLHVLSICGQQQGSGRDVLDHGGKVVLSWLSEPNGNVVMEIQAETLGYVALGISPSATMVDADVIVGWVKNGKGILQDRYSGGYTVPELDATQDLQLLASSENATHTMLKFRRKMDTGDAKDKPITTGPLSLIWAYHPDDPADPQKIQYHLAFRGAKVVTI